MKLKNIKRYTELVFLSVIVFLSSCDYNTTNENGFLEGTISIGPICPVEKYPPDPKCQPTAETFKAYPVYVCTPDGSKKIMLINPAIDGTFKVELAPGLYLIVLDRQKTGAGGSNLPIEVLIKSLETTPIAINIDTGIR